MNLPEDLHNIKKKIEERAREYGLDFFETRFLRLPFKQLNEVAAYGGFPNRYPHWKFGMEYERLSKSFAYGLHVIYEMVINNDPAYAYLLDCNNFVDQKIVMAHVYGHVDFFKNNFWFSNTDRKAIDKLANHAARIRGYEDKYGKNAVEEFVDICLSLDDLIDLHGPFIVRREAKNRSAILSGNEEEAKIAGKLKSKDYMDEFINPEAVLREQQEALDAQMQHKKEIELRPGYLADPEKDILLFLLEHAPLEPWQQDILAIIREEAYYFAPQGQTKIMNEGWASYWHTKSLTGSDLLDPYRREFAKPPLLTDNELIDFADHHSGTVATQPTRINPYKLGLELFRDIEYRWNRGRFGREYEECEDFEKKQAWNLDCGGGREKIFEVRRIYNDVTFIDTFLTEEFCREHKMFAYKFDPEQNAYVISGRDFKKVKEQLLFSITNWGRPFIYVKEANYENRGELYLWHRHEGMDLKTDYAEATLENLFRVWKRPIHLQTAQDGRAVLLKYNGEKHTRLHLNYP